MAVSPHSAGYSGTPLARKLGIAAGVEVLLLNPPEGYADWLAPLPPGVVFVDAPSPDTTMAHLFTDRQGVLADELSRLREALRPDAALWVSWPKKASKLSTDITEDVIRQVCLPLGWVDVKVCAVSAVWSGLKLVVRKALR